MQMDRKKTILIAVMINAGLLAVLFIAALTSQDDVMPMENTLSSSNYPLFPDEADSVLQNPNIVTSVARAPNTQQLSNVESVLPTVEVPLTPAPIVHKLPIPAIESVQQQAASATPSKKEDVSFLEVRVKKGDSLDKIARAHQITVDEIIRLNQLPGSFLKIGQVLKIPEKKIAVQVPKPKIAAEQIVAGGAEYYTVKVGDNPWTIAMKHHMKVEELLKLNLLNEEKARKLKPGDRLRIR